MQNKDTLITFICEFTVLRHCILPLERIGLFSLLYMEVEGLYLNKMRVYPYKNLHF